MDGIMNIYKEPGYTSFDVVAKLRGILKQKKIGHTGTLDPDAEGVLVVCLGNATKLSEMLTGKDKEYTAVLRLGVTTDTEDMSGRVLRELPVDCDEETVRAAVKSFQGEYQQIPPMYSAIKKDGKKLYELAHAGIEIDREPRQVEIYEIEVISIALPLVQLRVRCSKGTYIRSLCRDIGERLSCGGCMEHLLRNRVSSFTAETALKLSAVEQLKEAGRLKEAVSPIDSLFPSYRRLTVHRGAERYLYNGNRLTMESFPQRPDALASEELVFIYDTKGELKGLY
ncbi:MAG: tRNA pseudouridine(55) synthase TruB, partial [Lachnospiraceae bacterium]|nr:tRNA pseudouridine(55) synthase TruB [Lachnospiraceae bacterium]